MDNIAHTLIGGTLSRAGFDRRTPLATATMMIGANLPDIDVVAVASGTELAVRRGITHGVPALVILPFLLTGAMLLWDRHVRRRRNPALPPAIASQLLLASAVSILTHPFFDWLNVYGLRWLMPVVDRWYYADTLFIVDLFLWVSLALGYILSGRRRSPRPARIALSALAAYIATMMGITASGRVAISRQSGGTLGFMSPAMFVSPVPLNPFARDVIIAADTVYRTGSYRVGRGVFIEGEIPIRRDRAALAAAMEDPAVRRFIHWARFPFYRVTVEGPRTTIHIADARYSGPDGGGWSSVTVVVPTESIQRNR